MHSDRDLTGPELAGLDLADVRVARRLADAYQNVRFASSYEDVLRRARRRRWWLGVPAPVTAAALTLGVVASLLVGYLVVADRTAVRRAAARDVAWTNGFTAGCNQQWVDLARDNPAVAQQHRNAPPLADQIFAFRDGQRGLRLYVSETTLFGCVRDDAGQVTGRIIGGTMDYKPFLPASSAEVDYLVVLDPSGGPEYVVGQVPRDADRITAQTQARELIAGEIRGPFFALWASHGGLGRVTVTAFHGDQMVGTAVPSFLRGADDALVAKLCDKTVIVESMHLPAKPDWPGDEPVVPPYRLTLRDGFWVARFYASNLIMKKCELTDDGEVVSGHSASTYDGHQWHRWTPFSSMAQGFDSKSDVAGRSWVFGPAPAGAVRAELRFGDGRVIPAQLSGGFFGAVWHGASLDQVTVVVYTADTVYEHGLTGNVTVQHPR